MRIIYLPNTLVCFTKIRMMLYFLTLFTLQFQSLHAQDSLAITGSIDKALNGNTITLKLIYPYRSDLRNPVIEKESLIENGKFSFTTGAQHLELYRFGIKGKNIDKSMYLEAKPTVITFLDTALKSYELIGNETDKQYKSISPFLNRKNYTEKEVSDFQVKYILENIESPISTIILLDQVNKLSDSTIKAIYDKIPEVNRGNSSGRELTFFINNLMIGTKAPNFIQKDTAGIDFELSSTKGKYVLIDFWASWCIPCRAENPYLIKAFKKYHKKFNIISVALDQYREKWMQAISDDKIGIWQHTSDLKGSENEVSINYRIRSIPRNFLLDPNGTIVAKNLREKELLKLLTNLK